RTLRAGYAVRGCRSLRRSRPRSMAKRRPAHRGQGRAPEKLSAPHAGAAAAIPHSAPWPPLLLAARAGAVPLVDPFGEPLVDLRYAGHAVHVPVLYAARRKIADTLRCVRPRCHVAQ